VSDKKPLSADRRRMVAEVCLGHKLTISAEHIIMHWIPSVSLYHKDALTQTTARLVERKLEAANEVWNKEDREQALILVGVYDERLRHALATGDIPAIEQLCYELLESK
jgi:hypothetical protein